jgi:hypothetical protein
MNKSKVLKIMLNVIIIIILFLNINTKDNVKIISNLNEINYFQKIIEEELKEKKKVKAINLIKSYIPNYDNLINLKSSNLEDFNCLKRIININNEELFNNLINIDYDKSEVSFNYLDKNEDYYKNSDNIIKTHLYSYYIYANYKENIIKNPIYQIIKNNLEIDYTYTEPNLTEEYNNKSKYFQNSLTKFSKIFNNYLDNYPNINKYYENYYNDTYYLYYKNNYNYGYNKTEFIEFLIENKIIINNPNSEDIYKKHPYKFICNISSRTINNKPSIKINYYYSLSRFNNYCCSNYYGCYSCRTYINKNNIIDAINNDISNSYGTTIINNYNSYVFELDKNKGNRMIKHNLTNNMNNYYHSENKLQIENHYFIEKVFIDFPIISIYDEYEYIKLLISEITDIYNIPIIPPIKFI